MYNLYDILIEMLFIKVYMSKANNEDKMFILSKSNTAVKGKDDRL